MRDCCSSRSPIVVLAVYGHLCSYNITSTLISPHRPSPLLPFDPQRVRQEYMDVESEYLDRKGTYDKVAVGLEMDKQALEKECDTFQVSTVLSTISVQEGC
jgi:hypothetical protein